MAKDKRKKNDLTIDFSGGSEKDKAGKRGTGAKAPVPSPAADKPQEVAGNSLMPGIAIYKTNKRDVVGRSMILYGDSGEGKTHAVGTLPEGELLLINVDRGDETLDKRSHDAVLLETFQQLEDIYDALYEGRLKYKYVAIDDITELEKLFQGTRKSSNGKKFMSLKEYAQTSELMREWLRKFRNLCSKGISIIYTALAAPIKISRGEDIDETKLAPMLSPKLALEVPKLVDMVGRIETEPKTDNRRILFRGSRYFVAKTRVDAVEDVESVDLGALFARIWAASGDPKYDDYFATEEQREAIRAHFKRMNYTRGDARKVLQFYDAFKINGLTKRYATELLANAKKKEKKRAEREGK